MAGTVIASHYAEPLARVVGAPATLRLDPSLESAAVVELDRGESFEMLDNSRGWAWGYAGAERRVGYVPADVLIPA